mmetsp:Transcript_5439/g.10531  ORF Transcript_5439/g.10531 Transcript_5439/m.10531 type:complete len:247 (-) Transcript_5439:96-836(-)|eukprot:scaffold4796_cov264-Amphora_coffeaeformis.AAC.6
MSNIVDAEAEYSKLEPEMDKIEMARSYDKQTRRPKPIPERQIPTRDAREQCDVAERSRSATKDITIPQADGGNVFDVFSDEEDGMLAMFKAIRDLIFPPSEAQSEQERTRNVSEPVVQATEKKQEQQERMPKWQLETIDQFLRAWHHVEVSDAARMLATDEEDSVLAMCRDIGNSTLQELSSGSRVLSKVVLEKMQLAVEAAQGMTKRAMIMASDAFDPEGKNATVNTKAVGDFSMKAMLDPEEWM